MTRDAADDDEALQRQREGQPGGEQLAEAVSHPQGGAHAALDEQDVEHQEPEEAEEPDLLAEAGDDEVRLREVRQVRSAAAEARSEEPTVGHAHEATGELVRDRQRRGGERVEPQHDALLHVAEEQEGQVGAATKRIRPIAIQERRSVAT